eukprot:m.187966 g.187966  ORF g.187966 m.187966 type:complete len:103 (+) comp18172_c0_seq1:1161-1469(+)
MGHASWGTQRLCLWPLHPQSDRALPGVREALAAVKTWLEQQLPRTVQPGAAVTVLTCKDFSCRLGSQAAQHQVAQGAVSESRFVVCSPMARQLCAVQVCTST